MIEYIMRFITLIYHINLSQKKDNDHSVYYIMLLIISIKHTFITAFSLSFNHLLYDYNRLFINSYFICFSFCSFLFIDESEFFLNFHSLNFSYYFISIIILIISE